MFGRDLGAAAGHLHARMDGSVVFLCPSRRPQPRRKEEYTWSRE